MTDSSLKKIDQEFVKLVEKYFRSLSGLKMTACDGLENESCGLGGEPTTITANLLKARLLNHYTDFFGPQNTFERNTLTVQELFDILLGDWVDSTIDQFNLDETRQNDLYFMANELQKKVYTMLDKIASEGSSKEVLGEAARPLGKLLH